MKTNLIEMPDGSRVPYHEGLQSVLLDSPKKYCAEVFNQYGRRLAMCLDTDQKAAINRAEQKADEEIASANPRWKWRKVKRSCRIW